MGTSGCSMVIESRFSAPNAIPASGGAGLKPQHYADILQQLPEIGWFEVHPENYMGAGGPPHHYLSAIRDHYPISLHGVGLSIGSDGPINKDHLHRVKSLADRYEPGLFSEHLAWSTHDDIYYNDLLPLPYTEETLAIVVAHLDEVQSALKRQVLLENPTRYAEFQSSTMDEPSFLKEVCRRSGCGLLLDVNNVHISAHNLNFDALTYLSDFPLERVGEIHLAGHKYDEIERSVPGERASVIIDSHDRAISDPVWDLFEWTIARTGPIPSLIERDSEIPTWKELKAEVDLVENVLDGVGRALEPSVTHATLS